MTQPGELRRPGTEAGRTGLDRVLTSPRRTLLATDFDGTLAPIVADPATAFADPAAAQVLGRLAQWLGGVAVVTGRPVRDVLRLGGLVGASGLGGLRILGQYGVERWDAATGEVSAPDPHAGIDRLRRRLPDLLAELGLGDVHIEDKGLALGLHVRRLADPDGALDRLREPVSALADEHGLLVEPGKLVLELRAPGTDKGRAIESLLAGTDLDTVVYAGDDRGDLAAVSAVERLRAAGGAGLVIVVGAAPTDLAERADLAVDSPAALVAWLSSLADALDS